MKQHQEYSFEELIRRTLADYQPEPPATVWQTVEGSCPSPSQRAWRTEWLSVAAAGMAFLIALGLSVISKEDGVYRDYSAGVEAAHRSGKPLLILFSGNCPDCKQANANLQYLQNKGHLQGYIPVILHLGDTGRAASLALAGADSLYNRFSTAELCSVLGKTLLDTLSAPLITVMDLAGLPMLAQPFSRPQIENRDSLLVLFGKYLQKVQTQHNAQVSRGLQLFVDHCNSCHQSREELLPAAQPLAYDLEGQYRAELYQNTRFKMQDTGLQVMDTIHHFPNFAKEELDMLYRAIVWN